MVRQELKQTKMQTGKLTQLSLRAGSRLGFMREMRDRRE